jgi:hypothetical protein
MTPDDARACAKRWALVQEREAAELRRASMDTKLRQLSALMASRDLFGTEPHRESSEHA